MLPRARTFLAIVGFAICVVGVMGATACAAPLGGPLSASGGLGVPLGAGVTMLSPQTGYQPVSPRSQGALQAALAAPNPAGKFVSFDTGLKPVPPCSSPAALMPAWRAAARLFNLDWTVLAGITQVESDYGCNLSVSSAGAEGWTQFMPATWAEWGVDADGNGVASPYDDVDAIFSTARLLAAAGAPGNYRAAIFSYNHAEWYVEDVLRAARAFQNGQSAPVAYSASVGSSSATVRRLTAQARADQAQAARIDANASATERLETTLRGRLARLNARLAELQDRLAAKSTAREAQIASVERVRLGDREGPLTLAANSHGDPALVFLEANAMQASAQQAASVLRDVARRTARLVAPLKVAARAAAERLAACDREREHARSLARHAEHSARRAAQIEMVRRLSERRTVHAHA